METIGERSARSSKPFRPDQGREQIDEQEGGNGGGEVDHHCTSDPITRGYEGEAEPHAHQAEKEHRRYPSN
jgi:hypothetical protein